MSFTTLSTPSIPKEYEQWVRHGFYNNKEKVREKERISSGNNISGERSPHYCGGISC